MPTSELERKARELWQQDTAKDLSSKYGATRAWTVGMLHLMFEFAAEFGEQVRREMLEEAAKVVQVQIPYGGGLHYALLAAIRALAQPEREPLKAQAREARVR